MIQTMIASIILVDITWCLLVIGLYYQINILLDKLGITLTKEHKESKNYYVILSLMLGATLVAFIVSLINADIAMKIAPYVILLGFIGIKACAKKYRIEEPTGDISGTSIFERLAFLILIIGYLYMNKAELNMANSKIHKASFSQHIFFLE